MFLYVAFRGTNFADLWKSLKSANYLWVGLTVPFIVLSYWIRTVRWKYLLTPIKEKISNRNLFSSVMIGYSVNNILPRVGEFVRPVLLGNQEGISRTSAFGTVVVERILDFMTFYLITCATLFLYPRAIDPFVNDVESIRPFFLYGSIAGFALFVLLFFKAETFVKMLAKLRRFLPERLRPKVHSFVESFAAGFGVARMKNKFAGIFFLSLFLWLDYALIMFLPFYAFPQQLSALGFGASIVLLVVSSIAWVLPAPGAMGTYHSFLTVAMTKLYGVDSVTALSFSVITHEVGYIITMMLGGYFFFKDHLTVQKIEEIGHQQESGQPRRDGYPQS
ncbi:MAG: flippase-like domain-containing protein [Ignavibacteriales bacterium]|nr:flippase-like domain-containing protein [Ignavibacteriales bacterium]